MRAGSRGIGGEWGGERGGSGENGKRGTGRLGRNENGNERIGGELGGNGSDREGMKEGNGGIGEKWVGPAWCSVVKIDFHKGAPRWRFNGIHSHTYH